MYIQTHAHIVPIPTYIPSMCYYQNRYNIFFDYTYKYVKYRHNILLMSNVYFVYILKTNSN